MVSLFQVTVASTPVPVSSTSANGDVLEAPVAAFQKLFGTTPATSAGPMGTWLPAKSMLTVPLEANAITSRLTGAEWCKLPPVPVMVSGKVPSGVFALVVMVNVDVPAPVTVDGLKVPLVPAGKPETLRFTGLL